MSRLFQEDQRSFPSVRLVFADSAPMLDCNAEKQRRISTRTTHPFILLIRQLYQT
jgi:hypothetical protein